MKEITLSESKTIMLDILKEVAKFCDDNNIRYSLAYGTLLGAIRHKGFIPWDDDIDIMMPRPDYNRFVRLYHKNGNYAISSPLIDKGCFYVYSKIYDDRTLKYENGINYQHYPVLGIDIDVFPLDGVPNDLNNKTYLLLSNIRYKLGRQIALIVAPNCHQPSLKGKIINALITPVCRLIGKDFFIKKYIQLATHYPYEKSDYVHVSFPSIASIHLKHQKKNMEKRVKVWFEDSEYWAPACYDDYLKSMYDDYMQLPPKEKQQTHHSNKIYWKA